LKREGAGKEGKPEDLLINVWKKMCCPRGTGICTLDGG